jgi:hypothetical protein
MKKLAILLFSILISFNSYGKEITRESITDFCSGIETLAEAIMISRQEGVAVSELMKIADKSTSVLSSIQRLMITEVFEKPRFTVGINKTEAIEDYKNGWFLSCYKEQIKKLK